MVGWKKFYKEKMPLTGLEGQNPASLLIKLLVCLPVCMSVCVCPTKGAKTDSSTGKQVVLSDVETHFRKNGQKLANIQI